jgi:hypothetical protein
MTNALIKQAATTFLACCSQPRYRTAWLLGSPLVGKTLLAQQLCVTYKWHYLNYTLDAGFFDLLESQLETYQPHELLSEIRRWCATCKEPILFVDEIDALLAVWSSEQRRLFAYQASRLPNLSCGLILVTNFFDITLLKPLLPESDLPAYFFLSGAQS